MFLSTYAFKMDHESDCISNSYRINGKFRVKLAIVVNKRIPSCAIRLKISKYSANRGFEKQSGIS